MGWEIVGEPGRAGGKGSHDYDDSIVISKYPNGHQKDQFTFRIGCNVVAAMRWQAGDKVVLVKNSDILGIQRVNAKSGRGWTLSKTTSELKNTLRFKVMSQKAFEAGFITEGVFKNPLVDRDVLIVGEVKQ